MRPTIRSYAEAARFLGRSESRGTGQRGTYVVRLTPTAISVRYHQTDVVTYYHPEIVGRLARIDTGGWTTQTTVARINEYCPEGHGAERHEDEGGCLIWFGHLATGAGAWLGEDGFVIPREHSEAVR